MTHVVYKDHYLNACPPDELVGWCHNCETWQRGRHRSIAVVKSDRPPGAAYRFGCVNRCYMESWDMGIWTCPCPEHRWWHLTEDEAELEAAEHERTLGASLMGKDPHEPRPCWQEVHGDRADHQCESYVNEPCPHEDLAKT